MKTLLFATNNKHKLEEMRAIAGKNIHILSLNDVGFEGDIPETSSSIAGNAIQKAQYLFERLGIAVFADDTGLEVEALDGAPGVHSARYASENATYEENVRKLLKALEGKNNRSARFVTVIALISSDGMQVFEGVVNGHILQEAKGQGGFGYDPVFVPKGHKLTYAEMDAAQKNLISHRALATHKLIEHLKTQNQPQTD